MRWPLASHLRGFVSHWWRFKTTRDGKLLACAIAVAASVASATLDSPAYNLLCALSALAVVAYVTGRLLRPRIGVNGYFPEKAVAGQAVTGRFEITNRGRRTARGLSAGFFGLPRSLAEEDAGRVVRQLSPGDSAAVPVTLLPARRGVYSLPELQTYATFPFGLVRTPVKLAHDGPPPHPASLLVLPHFQPVDSIDVPVSECYQPGGIALSSHIGQSPEYIGNRAYRPGDPTRHIDHRSWARLAVPVVREFQEEYYCRIALVLDTFVPGRAKPPPDGFEQLEAAVSLAASVADALARGEYILDVFAAGPELYVFRAGRHTAHFENVLEILACIDACRTNPFERVTLALTDELATISSVVCVLLDWDERREALVRAAVEEGCSVKVFIVRGGETTRPFEHVEGIHSVTVYPPAAIREGGIETL